MVNVSRPRRANRRSYVMRSCLGRGGFGAVYRATMKTEHGFQMDVALKFLNEQHNADPAVRGRLRDEARIIGLLRHRAIVKVHHLGVINHRWSVVMEYLPGLTAEALLNEGRLCARHAVELVAEVAAALDHAWTALGPDDRPLHVMHRDIKPSNLLVTEHGEVKVLDFGIARAELTTRESETREGTFGTQSYMAPERFQLRQDASTDVYSLGATLFELLAGEPLGPALLKPKAHNQFIEQRIGSLPHRPDGLIELLLGSLIFSPEQRLDASGFYDLCQGLLAEEWLEEPSLKDWAEQVVPLLLKRQQTKRTDDPLVGVELFEEEDDAVEPPLTRAMPAPKAVHPRRVDDPALATTPLDSMAQARASSGVSAAPSGPLSAFFGAPAQSASPSRPVVKQLAETSGWFALRTAGIWATAGLGLCCAVALGAAGVGMLSGDGADHAATQQSAIPAVAATPSGAGSPSLEGEVIEEEPLPSPAATPKTLPERTKDGTGLPRPVDTPRDASPRGAYVRLTGDVSSGALVGAAGRFKVPGVVPPGEYTLDFAYPAWKQAKGTVVIPATDAVSLNCQDRFARCLVE
jgi:serine/threonine protein kinase